MRRVVGSLLAMLLLCARLERAAGLRLYAGLGDARGGRAVRPISIPRAARVLEGWVLEMKYHMDSEAAETFPDGITDVDLRRTDDSISGPFRLPPDPADAGDAAAAEQLVRIHDVIVWIRNKTPRRQKSVFAVVATTEAFAKEQALAFVETRGTEVTVNGYITSPHVADGDADLRALLALELLNVATASDSSLTFLPLS